MGQYGKFAGMYDCFMDDIPYDEWSELVIDILKEYNTGNKLLELGCGTGNMSKRLVMAGYSVMGLDISADMVKAAQKKIIPNFAAANWDMRIPYMADNVVYDGAVSLCDSMNYLLDKDDLLLTFKAVYEKIADDGVFIFDMKTEEFYKNVLGDNVFADRRKNMSYIWENTYDEKRHVNSYDITFYKRLFGNIFINFTEHHTQRAYDRDVVIKLAKKCDFSFEKTVECEERVFYVFRKKSVK